MQVTLTLRSGEQRVIEIDDELHPLPPNCATDSPETGEAA